MLAVSSSFGVGKLLSPNFYTAVPDTQDPYETDHDFSVTPSPLSFKDELLSMTKSNQITDEQALKAAKDVVRAFYTQTLKVMFEEIKQDEEESNAMETYKELLVEQIAENLGNNVTDLHRQLAKDLKKSSAGSVPDQANLENSASPHDQNFPKGGVHV